MEARPSAFLEHVEGRDPVGFSEGVQSICLRGLRVRFECKSLGLESAGKYQHLD